MHHSKVVQSPNVNNCLKINFEGSTELQLVTKLLLQVSVLEPHNSLVSDTEYGGIKETIDTENNRIFSDSTLRSLLPPQLKEFSTQYKVMCARECCISSKNIHSSLLSWRDCYLKTQGSYLK